MPFPCQKPKGKAKARDSGLPRATWASSIPTAKEKLHKALNKRLNRKSVSDGWHREEIEGAHVLVPALVAFRDKGWQLSFGRVKGLTERRETHRWMVVRESIGKASLCSRITNRYGF